MASTSFSIHGARKLTFKTEVVTSSSEPFEKYAYTKLQFEDEAGAGVTEISSFRCNGIIIEDADKLDVFFVKNSEGKTRLEVKFSDSALGIEVEDVERTDAKTILDSTQE